LSVHMLVSKKLGAQTVSVKQASHWG